MREETDRTTVLQEQIEGLRRMTVGQLRITYREVFGEDSRSRHKQFLFRRVAWRIQANALGGLSERARRRALEIADDADLRICEPRNLLRVAKQPILGARPAMLICELQPPEPLDAKQSAEHIFEQLDS